MNESKNRDSRMWQKWEKSGAVSPYKYDFSTPLSKLSKGQLKQIDTDLQRRLEVTIDRIPDAAKRDAARLEYLGPNVRI